MTREKINTHTHTHTHTHLLSAQEIEPVKSNIRSDKQMLVHLADNLMRGYLPVIGSGDEGVAEEAAVWAAMAFHPNIERTADAILRELGLSQYNAMHVRRGDKQTDPGYDFMFDVLNASFFEV